MTVERELFLEIMASFPSGVGVVATLDGDEPRGLTTTALSSVSADPPLLLVCVDVTSRTLPTLLARRGFVVNFLRSGRDELARLFASKAEHKFDGVPWRPSPGGLPVLHEDAVAWAECTTEREIEAGDHLILVGRVEAGAALRPDEAPLLYYRRRWGEWTPRPAS
jgi:flavin reductase (DIM6/NTAB) family NADH-FMN oxidoreductase RutF